MKKHVICAISGGVDSAIAAYMLLKQGYRVTGCFMKNWDRQNEISEGSGTNTCQADLDKEDARYVCEKLNIPFIDFDFTKEYWNNVFSQFLKEYEQGFTPNPDILCNKYIKFPLMYEYCKKKFDQVDYIATGHYARVKYDPIVNRHCLLKSIDRLKDQTFFLSQLDPKLLPSILFPVGHLEKTEVRKLAKEIGLERVYKKRGSVGICFIGKRNFNSFIDQYLPQRTGQIIDIETNKAIGEHSGIHHYTVGQKISIDHKTHDKAYYVAKKNAETQDLYVAKGTDHPSLYHDEFYVNQPHWISENLEEGLNKEKDEVDILDDKITFKFQQKHNEAKILSLKRVKQINRVRYLMKTKYPFRGITPGQFVVFYNNEECIGSAKVIETPISLFDRNHNGPIVNTDQLLNKKYYSLKDVI